MRRDDYTYWSDEFPPRVLDASIGKFCSVAAFVRVMSFAEEHNTRLISAYPFCEAFPGEPLTYFHYPVKKATAIGNDVWIGERAYLAAGLKIGDGAVIGAHSVVTKDVPPYSVVAGNPARIVRMRFNENEIGMLLEMRWWDWPIEKIKKALKLLTNNNVGLLYRYYLSEVKGE